MFNFLRRQKLKLICFDLDNTLYDFGSAEAETEAHISEILSKKIGKRTIDILRVFNEVKKSHLHIDRLPEMYSRRLWIEETLNRLNKKMKFSYVKKIEEEYWKYLAKRIKLFPETLHVLASLRKKYKIACISDSDGIKRIKMERIKALGLDKYFDFFITTDDTGKNKPAIENWEHLLKISGFSGRECMMVGDHPDMDLLCAKNLGFVTVWTKEHIPTTIHFKYVDYSIKNIGEVLKIVEKY